MCTSLTDILWLSFCNLYQIFDFMLQNIVLLLSKYFFCITAFSTFSTLILFYYRTRTVWKKLMPWRNAWGSEPFSQFSPRGKSSGNGSSERRPCSPWRTAGEATAVRRTQTSTGSSPRGNPDVRRGESPSLNDWPACQEPQPLVSCGIQNVFLNTTELPLLAPVSSLFLWVECEGLWLSCINIFNELNYRN